MIEILNECQLEIQNYVKNCSITSTTGNSVSILGTIMLFTPAAPLGLAMVLAGSATSMGTSVA